METTCQRCDRGLPATHRVESDLLKLKVCGPCAQEALALPQRDPGRLFVSPLPS